MESHKHYYQVTYAKQQFDAGSDRRTPKNIKKNSEEHRKTPLNYIWITFAGFPMFYGVFRYVTGYCSAGTSKTSILCWLHSKTYRIKYLQKKNLDSTTGTFCVGLHICTSFLHFTHFCHQHFEVSHNIIHIFAIFRPYYPGRALCVAQSSGSPNVRTPRARMDLCLASTGVI